MCIRDRYRTTDNIMLSKNDIISKGEIRKFKFERELHLHRRMVNVQNHCFNHRCSVYCWRVEFQEQKFNPEVHANNPNVVSVITKDSRGQPKKVKVKLYKCRMGFGYKLVYPKHGDFTGGSDARLNHQ